MTSQFKVDNSSQVVSLISHCVGGTSDVFYERERRNVAEPDLQQYFCPESPSEIHLNLNSMGGGGSTAPLPPN